MSWKSKQYLVKTEMVSGFATTFSSELGTNRLSLHLKRLLGLEVTCQKPEKDLARVMSQLSVISKNRYLHMHAESVGIGTEYWFRRSSVFCFQSEQY